MNVKKCPKCGLTKELSAFSKCSRSNSGLQTYCKACKAAYHAHRHATDPGYRAMRNKQSSEHYYKDIEQSRADGRARSNYKYYHDDEFYENERQRRNQRRNAVGEYTTEQWVAALEHFEYQCAYCGETSNLTVEHIVPISKRGTNYIYNLIPACAHCNGSKGAKEIVEWYTTRDYYSEHRLLKIHAWYMAMQKHLPILKDGENPSC